MPKILSGKVSYQKMLGVFKYSFTPRLMDQHEQKFRNRKMRYMLRNDKWLGEPAIKRLIRRHHQF